MKGKGAMQCIREYGREIRDKKAFLSKQCKEIEESNRIVKTSDLFKKTEVKFKNKIKLRD